MTKQQVESRKAKVENQDDAYEPLRSKLTLREAQYLNSYIKTGDVAILNALALGIISRRDELLAALKHLHSCHRAFSSNDNWTSIDDEARAEAEAAIAAADSSRRSETKAEGRAQ